MGGKSSKESPSSSTSPRPYHTPYPSYNPSLRQPSFQNYQPEPQGYPSNSRQKKIQRTYSRIADNYKSLEQVCIFYKLGFKITFLLNVDYNILIRLQKLLLKLDLNLPISLLALILQRAMSGRVVSQSVY